MSFHSAQSVRFNNTLSYAPLAPPIGLSGTATGTSNATGYMRRRAVSAGTATGTSAATAVITRSRPLSGISTGTSASTSVVVRARIVSGSSTGSSMTLANNVRRRRQAGTATGTSSLTGAFIYQTAADLVPAVTLSSEGKNVTVSWDAVPLAIGYAIRRNGASLTSTTDTSFVDVVPADGDYTYQVASQQSGSTYSTYSSPQAITIRTIFLAVPEVTYLAGASRATLTWEPVALATAYEILRDGVAVTLTAQSPYVDLSLPDGVYQYSVRAKEPSGAYSSWSKPVRLAVDMYDLGTRPSVFRVPLYTVDETIPAITLGREPSAEVRRLG